MKSFFSIIFSKFYVILKDSFSATALVSYLLSLNIFTVIGYYETFFQHSRLSDVPLFYAIIIMFLAGLFTHYVLLKKIKGQHFIEKVKQSLSAGWGKSTWITVAYVIGSFVLMLTVI
jgi:hypothetical protein